MANSAGRASVAPRESSNAWEDWSRRYTRIGSEQASLKDAIWDEHPGRLRQSLQNDLLIACTATRIGAGIVTQNTADFRFIRPYFRHDGMTLEDLAVSLRGGSGWRG